jgi:hypothetical protein
MRNIASKNVLNDLPLITEFVWSRSSAVGIVTVCRTGQPRGRSSSAGMVKDFHFSISSKPALGPSKAPIECVRELFPRGVKRPG